MTGCYLVYRAVPLATLLLREYGAVLTSAKTARLLGYRSTRALAKASERGQLPVEMFLLQGRHGWFAQTSEVEAWLLSLSGPHEGRTPL